MNFEEIIKESFEFPFKNKGLFSLFIVLTTLTGSFALSGLISFISGIFDPVDSVMGLLSFMIALLLGMVVSGYLISVVKSGIKQDNDLPEFKWEENFFTGMNNYIVSIVYVLIPTVIVLIIGYLANIYGTYMFVINEIIKHVFNVLKGASLVNVFNAISWTILGFKIYLAILVIVALIVFIIFSFLYAMAQCRFAKTGDLVEALNIVEAAKDMTKIGLDRVIIVMLTLIVIVAVIELVLSFLSAFIPFLSVLSIIITPYLLLSTQRAIGLLYSGMS